jgi:hypothetical protein
MKPEGVSFYRAEDLSIENVNVFFSKLTSVMNDTGVLGKVP